ncbi:type II CRISPR-associated endonuclease Cas1 [Nitratidesulfovibrio vulgaris]|uniref:type II CRISPR-associated endonuclease Cas1 n=1 Tax=Nitratidesulfovibrio vulgaris TaxID=881 RepID=UPI00230006D8|nr:type II CRISPR-associated endonuclease Cas1 [Nitratidesulfovibrio vulgaris]WCB45262.1 type II CRISPR-associated endonuclease Cas1 [Nitratidesulfovibrio vulgaris]
MFGNIVEIAQEGRHLAVDRGLLVVCEGEQECGRIPLDTIEAVILSARQVSLTRPVMAALAAHDALVVVCDANYAPTSILAPYADNFEAGKRMRAQARASTPLGKRLWKLLVQRKLHNQATVLAWHRPDSPKAHKLHLLAKAVRSGDTGNAEGQGARLYWRALLGPTFVRDPERQDCNTLFNYAYTVLRTAVARSIVGAGLHPALGVHHHNRSNAFALADDMMEPYRPLADHVVLEVLQADTDARLTPPVKRQLAAVLQHPVQHEDTTIPLYQGLHHVALGIARSYTGGKVCVPLPEIRLGVT